jgi:hypothetical protein
VRLAERILAIESAQASSSASTQEPKDALDAEALSWIHHRRGAFTAEAGVLGPWLPPKATGRNLHLQGAIAALRAARGEGTDATGLDELRRASLRSHALEWLRAELVALTAPADKEVRGEAILKVRTALERIRRDAAVLPFQDDAVLATLPEEERAAWRALWADFDAAVAQLRPPPVSEEEGK